MATIAVLISICVAASPSPAGAAVPSRHTRIVAVGDLHGDFTTARSILVNAGVMDEAGEWAGGNATLVQLGDCVDRGIDGHGIIDMLLRLRDSALDRGGRVHLLVGNHELMNVKRELDFVDPREAAAHGTAEERAQRFAPTGRYGSYIRTLPLTVAVGSTVFCHGGLRSEFARLGTKELNRRGRAAMRSDADLYAPVLMNDGPVWTRTIIYAALRGECRPLQQALAAISKAEGRTIDKMVVGHSAQPDGKMRLLCGNRLAGIDVYASSFFSTGGFSTFLEITDDGGAASEEGGGGRGGLGMSWRQMGPFPLPVPAAAIRRLAATLTKPSEDPFDAEKFMRQEAAMLEEEEAIEKRRQRSVGAETEGDGVVRRQQQQHRVESQTQRPTQQLRRRPPPHAPGLPRAATFDDGVHGGVRRSQDSLALYYACLCFALTLAFAAWWRHVVVPRRLISRSKKCDSP